MKCDYCNEPISTTGDGGYIQLKIADNCQYYHTKPKVMESLSCWQLMLLGWSHAIESTSNGEEPSSLGYKPSRLRAVG